MTSDATPQMPNIHRIQLLLVNLVLGKAPGPDGLTAYIFKHCASKISPILQMHFTQSLNTCTFPEDWLTANISSVYKKGSRSMTSNYRPVSLTSVCSKVIEHIVCISFNHAAIMQHNTDQDIPVKFN